MRFSMEYRYRIRPRDMLVSLHLSRSATSSAASRRLAASSTSAARPRVTRPVRSCLRGYPYVFDELVIIDLPHDHAARHLPTHSAPHRRKHLTVLGTVRYRYHSMADLSAYDDGSFDLVYSGQTFEHVTESDGDKVLAEVFRVPRPGGWFYLDTPNGPVCRIQQADFINPDHEVEYSHDEMLGETRWRRLRRARAARAELVGTAVSSGNFSIESAVRICRDVWHPGRVLPPRLRRQETGLRMRRRAALVAATLGRRRRFRPGGVGRRQSGCRAEPVVLIPGWHGKGGGFTEVISALESAGFTVLDFDPKLPGQQALNTARPAAASTSPISPARSSTSRSSLP